MREIREVCEISGVIAIVDFVLPNKRPRIINSTASRPSFCRVAAPGTRSSTRSSTSSSSVTTCSRMAPQRSAVESKDALRMPGLLADQRRTLAQHTRGHHDPVFFSRLHSSPGGPCADGSRLHAPSKLLHSAIAVFVCFALELMPLSSATLAPWLLKPEP